MAGIQDNNKANDNRDTSTSFDVLNIALSKSQNYIYSLETELQDTLYSKSFILGYVLLHPWRFPQVLNTVLTRVLQKVNIAIKDRLDVARAGKYYSEVDRDIKNHKNEGNKDTAIILHLYYTDMWNYFRTKLDYLDHKTFDLFVSIPIGVENIREEILRDYPSACIVRVPNRGRDVLPFIKILSTLHKNNYKYILKIHSKKSKHINDGVLWRDNIVDSLIPRSIKTQEALYSTLAMKNTSILGSKGQYITLLVNYQGNVAKLKKILTRIKSKEVSSMVDINRYKYGFFAGTMFWARVDAFQEIIDTPFPIDAFQLEHGQVDNTLAHALERIFTILPEVNNKHIYEISTNGVNRIRYQTDNSPRWSTLYKCSRDSKN